MQIADSELELRNAKFNLRIMQSASGELQTAKCILQSGTVNYKLQFANCKLPSAYYKMQTANCKIRIAIRILQIRKILKPDSARTGLQELKVKPQ